VRGRQRFQCLACNRQFIPPANKTRFRLKLRKEYVWNKQTLKQLAEKYKRSIRWVQKQLDLAPTDRIRREPQKIIAVTDTTYFGRGYGVLVIRCPRLRKNLHFHEVVSEAPSEYLKARQELEGRGYVIEGAVIDGKRGVSAVFSDLPVQLCQFHQVSIMRRYLTLRPKLLAGKELRALALSLTTSTEKIFCELLDLWYQKWRTFLQEKTYDQDGIHWRHTHKKSGQPIEALKRTYPTCLHGKNIPNLKCQIQRIRLTDILAD